MKKFLLAATAVSLLIAPAAATTVEVQRQTLLQNGEHPLDLRESVTAAVTVSGTFTGYQCVLTWTGSSPSPDELLEPAAQALTQSIAGSTSFSSQAGTLLLNYTGRINPQGMAVGNAFYSADDSQVTLVSPPPLECPAGGSVVLGATQGTPPFQRLETQGECASRVAQDPNLSAEIPGQYCLIQSNRLTVTDPGTPGSPGTTYFYTYQPQGTPTMNISSIAVGGLITP